MGFEKSSMKWGKCSFLRHISMLLLSWLKLLVELFFGLFQILTTGSSILSVLSGSPSLFVVSCLWVSASKLASNSSKIFHGCKIQRLMISPICTTSNIGLNQVCTLIFGGFRKLITSVALKFAAWEMGRDLKLINY